MRVVDDTERLCQECARRESELFPAKRLRVGIVKLRDHPLMNYHGIGNWPPVWVNTRAEPVTKISGEVGTLTRTAFFPDTPTRLFLMMELEKERYIGCLFFSKAGFCEQLSKILETNAGRPIEKIGDLDLSFTL